MAIIKGLNVGDKIILRNSNGAIRDRQAIRYYEFDMEFSSRYHYNVRPELTSSENEFVIEALGKYGTAIVSKTGNGTEDVYVIQLDTSYCTPSIAEYTPKYIPEDELNPLLLELKSLLTEYQYTFTDFACIKLLDTWYHQKQPLIELFKKHPNYNGKYQIAFDADYERCKDDDAIYKFSRMVLRWMQGMIIKKESPDGLSLSSIRESIEKLRSKCPSKIVKSDGNFTSQFLKFKDKVDLLSSKQEEFEYNGIWKPSKIEYNKKMDIANRLLGYTYSTIDNDMFEFLNEQVPDIHPHAQAKTSRTLNKLLQMYGIDKFEHEEDVLEPLRDENGNTQADEFGHTITHRVRKMVKPYNREFAKYSDAINPIKTKRHTIISINPIDYLTMSFGNSWQSCHTIDKIGIRSDRGGSGYSGCYSSGTISYMLDSTSCVFYTIDKDYDGNEYELQDKINRCMFHYGEEKLVQGRVYPQSNDGAQGETVYKEIREICQKVFADMLNVPNYWVNKKGTSWSEKYIDGRGTNYKDYQCYDGCNLSWLKSDENSNKPSNTNDIIVGHNPICIETGIEHDNAACINACDHYGRNR